MSYGGGNRLPDAPEDDEERAREREEEGQGEVESESESEGEGIDETPSTFRTSDDGVWVLTRGGVWDPPEAQVVLDAYEERTALALLNYSVAWNRLSMRSALHSMSATDSVLQTTRDRALERLQCEMASGTNLRAGCFSELRNIVRATLEARYAFASRRGSTDWTLSLNWYRAAETVISWYPQACRRNERFYSEPNIEASPGMPDRMWIEYLMDTDLLDLTDEAAQVDRNREVRMQLERLGVAERLYHRVRNLIEPLEGYDPAYLRNRIRVLMCETMNALPAGVQAWPDPIWETILCNVRQWDEERFTMHSVRERAQRLVASHEMNGAIEANALVRETAQLLVRNARTTTIRNARERARQGRAWVRVSGQRDHRIARSYGPGATPEEREAMQGQAHEALLAGARRNERIMESVLYEGTRNLAIDLANEPPRAAALPGAGVCAECFSDLVAKCEALEEQMEKCEIKEGDYLVAMNALRDEYKETIHPIVSVD